MTDHNKVAFPPELKRRESELIKRRRSAPSVVQPEHAIGVGLSGGGIRSATFCLGVFQSLAKHELLSKIDYLSTVSGGGYFGSFLGRLYTRGAPLRPAENQAELPNTAPRVKGPAEPANQNSDQAAELNVQNASDVEAILRGDKARGVLRALRSNGRYLSPSGGGDLLLAAAVLLRNWFALLTVLFVSLIAVLAWIEGIRAGCAGLFPKAIADFERWLNPANGFAAGRIYWSAWIAVGPALFTLYAVPLGVAYWIPRSRWQPALYAALGALTFGFASAYLRASERTGWIAAGVATLMSVTAIALGFANHHGHKKMAEDATRDNASHSTEELEVDTEVRSLLSRWFSTGFWTSVAMLGIGALDSLGRTIYALIHLDRFEDWQTWLVSGATALLSGGFAARSFSFLFAKRPGESRVALPTSLLSGLAALAVCSFVLITSSVTVQALTWNFSMPSGARQLIVPEEVVVHWSTDSIAKDSRLEFRERRPRSDARPSAAIPVASDAATSAEGTRRDMSHGHHIAHLAQTHASYTLGWILGLTLLAWLLGRTERFLVFSSHHPLYSARLTRAYLGPSNPKRFKNNDMTEVMPGDDLSLDEYYPLSLEEPGPIAKGAPLHFINVTINETLDTETKLQQPDRRGMGMALGPCGISVGIRHHATFWWKDVAETRRPSASDPATSDKARVDEAAQVRWSRPDDGSGAEEAVFPRVPHFRPEALSLGRWVSLSGAAFSTGLGSRTSMALSLLAGLFNIRLGLWWNPRLRESSSVRHLFAAQRYLMRELFARFPGTSNRRWYLSDGGHFENMGGYELIRRRIRKMVIIDAEADPDYTYDGLADLVRKARLDFGAEITFMDRDELYASVAPAVRPWLGPLQDLRRLGEGALSDTPDRSRPSLAHAALATIKYRDGSEGVLLYIKPTLLGRESADLMHYHSTHMDFPQETTADQFFDEAQWESYRKLGAHIGDLLFSAKAQAGEFVPRDLFDWTPKESSQPGVKNKDAAE